MDLTNNQVRVLAEILTEMLDTLQYDPDIDYYTDQRRINLFFLAEDYADLQIIAIKLIKQHKNDR